jgi:hypothetical protein
MVLVDAASYERACLANVKGAAPEPFFATRTPAGGGALRFDAAPPPPLLEEAFAAGGLGDGLGFVGFAPRGAGGGRGSGTAKNLASVPYT